jgi:hypothetical protein
MDQYIDLETTKGTVTFEVKQMDGVRQVKLITHLVSKLGPGVFQLVDGGGVSRLFSEFDEDEIDKLRTDVLWNVSALIEGKKEDHVEKKLGALFQSHPLNLIMLTLHGVKINLGEEFRSFFDQWAEKMKALPTLSNMLKEGLQMIEDKVKSASAAQASTQESTSPGSAQD